MPQDPRIDDRDGAVDAVMPAAEPVERADG